MPTIRSSERNTYAIQILNQHLSEKLKRWRSSNVGCPYYFFLIISYLAKRDTSSL